VDTWEGIGNNVEDTEWLDVIIDGKMVQINGKGEIRETRPNA
jgi:hypothetical protein